jgi:hypothetical protein
MQCKKFRDKRPCIFEQITSLQNLDMEEAERCHMLLRSAGIVWDSAWEVA